MLQFAVTIFLSAFLLFQVQPLIGKYVLPWYGGTPSVWATCMLFFQLFLLGGYAYAHLIAKRLQPKHQAILHFTLLGISLLMLPIVPDSAWKPVDAESPSLRILLLLGATIGAPYLLLSSTGPLLQMWFHQLHPGKSPYRLYALSNIGSLLALLSYPFLVEPNFRLGTQSVAWSWGYAAFALLCISCGYRIYRNAAEVSRLLAEESNQTQPQTKAPSWGDILMWAGLSAAGSIMLLATTNQISQEVAVVPFLWVLPLAIYLLTFIIAFDSPRWYHRAGFILLLTLAIVWNYAMFQSHARLSGLVSDWLPSTMANYINLFLGGAGAPIWFQIASFLTTLFAICMICHGELYHSRPAPQHLTLFYLALSCGGAIGGAFVALVAPNIFPDFWEYHIAIPLACSLALVAFYRDPNWILYRGKPLTAWGIIVACLVSLVLMQIKSARDEVRSNMYMSRNFYGAIKIYERGSGTEEHRYDLTHGVILHGFQFKDPERSTWPTSYYGDFSGVGLAISSHPKRMFGDRTLRIGVIGLGTGTLATLALPKDTVRFYEINPEIVQLSEPQDDGSTPPYFTYLEDARRQHVNIEVVTGDARVQMEHELERGESQKFDVLAVDAFSSDAIPMHLLTKECVEVYLQHLQPDGILALHISNRHLDLKPVCKALAEEFGYQLIRIQNSSDDANGVQVADWLLLTKNQGFLNSLPVQYHKEELPADTPAVLWTDDYGSLWQVLYRPEF